MANSVKRFWANVKRRKNCWEWVGSCTATGYGSFCATYEGRKYWKAHRFSWHLHNGPIPDGQCVLHKCDNPACVRPDHLEIGTQAENIRQRDMRGRGPIGVKHGSAKLTEAQVLVVYHSKENGMRLAERLGVHNSVIYNIRKGKTWSHLTGHIAAGSGQASE